MNRRRALLLLAALALAWGVLVAVTGGVVVEMPWGRLSSRAAIRPLLIGGLLLLFYGVHLRGHWRSDVGALADVPVPYVILGTALVVTLAVGFGWGTRVAGGPDASGYVSQASMFVRGELTTSTPEWARDAPWNDAALTAAPIGYRPTQQTHILAPTYSPGLPLIMAMFQMIGGADAVFYVVPVLGAVMVWATWLIGKALDGVWAGAIASALVAMSPAFLMMLVQPMSDVPAAAFWTLAIAASMRGRPVAAGAATAVAILIRPNVVPLASIPALLLMWERRGRLTRLAAFATAVLPAAAAIGLLNAYYHGSPLRSGYGTLNDLYSVDNVAVNLQRYGTWFVDSQTPLPLIGLMAPAFARTAARGRLRVALVTSAFPAVVFALYLPYLAFHAWEWSYLRFLLPGYPALMVGFAIVVLASCRRLREPLIAAVTATLLAGAVGVHGWEFARTNNVFAFKAADERYARAVEFVKRLPPRSILISLAHSGPLRFYTGRDVLRFEALASQDVDKAMAHLQARGYGLYLVVDDFEVDMFRSRVAGTRTAMLLDAAPRVDLGGSFVYTLSASH